MDYNKKLVRTSKARGHQRVLIMIIFAVLVNGAILAAIGEGPGGDPGGDPGQGEGANGDQNQNATCNQTQQQQQNGTCNQSQEQNGEGNQNQEQNGNGTQNQEQNGNCDGNGTGDQNQEQNGNCTQNQEQNCDCNCTQEQKREQNQNESCECGCDCKTYSYRWQDSEAQCISKQEGEGKGNQWRNRYQNEIQAGAENGTVIMETTFMKREQYMLQENNHYQIGMKIELLGVKGNRVRVRVSAEFQEGKVAAINIAENVLKFGKSGESNIYFDGKKINNGTLEEVIAGEGTEAKYVGEVGDGGAQFLVYIPHFSTHIIEIESLLDQIKEDLFTGTNFVVMGIGSIILIGLSGHVYKIGKSRD